MTEIRQVFEALVDLGQDERARRLEELAEERPELHAEVSELLRADTEADSLLERFSPPEPPSDRGSAREQVFAEMEERVTRGLSARYAIDGELARGGMAVVYRARDLETERPVAVKVLEPEFARALGGERFLKEIRIARGLSHPAIVDVTDSGETEGLLYYVMPLIDGESLASRLAREGALPLSQALAIAIQCSDALAHAHEKGVIHRDVKPGNILLQGDQARLVDFGIARALDEASEVRLTETGISVGTVGYMSPEQAVGDKDVDERTDLYSLGAVLYEMLTAERAFTGRTPQAIMARQLAGEVSSVGVIRPELPAEVDALIRRTLQPDPGKRHRTAVELGEALRELRAPRS